MLQIAPIFLALTILIPVCRGQLCVTDATIVKTVQMKMKAAGKTVLRSNKIIEYKKLISIKIII